MAGAVIFVQNSAKSEIPEGRKNEVINIPMTVPAITPINIFLNIPPPVQLITLLKMTKYIKHLKEDSVFVLLIKPLLCYVLAVFSICFLTVEGEIIKLLAMLL